jgi:anti-sigma factor RsiW
MNGCSRVQAQFTGYLDGQLTGVEMQRVGAHLDSCAGCAAEWRALKEAQAALAALGPVPEPEDLPLRIRVAVSRERARRARSPFASLDLAWRNTVGPLLLQAGAGLASAVLLIGTVVVSVGIVAKPATVRADDEPLGAVTAPRFSYSIAGTGDNEIAALPAPVVVEAYVSDTGLVYDYSIIAGPDDSSTRSQVENLLLSDRFEPARAWGKPVRGIVVLNFSGVSVRG